MVLLLKVVVYLVQTEYLTVSSVAPGSIGEEVGVESGDRVLRINNTTVADIIDYYFLTCEQFLQMEIRKPSGEIWRVEIENKDYENLGLAFVEDLPGGLRKCANKCIFCFIDQLPTGMRDTLYIKDDDYRHSFLYGNYISLTNLSRGDWERIIRMRLSPLYVSVHTTNPRLRAKMLHNQGAGNIMQQLEELAESGITVHVQVVVCPGINDGLELDRTLRDLESLWPSVSSVAVVPVGITKYRPLDFPFFPVDRFSALDIIHRVEKMQEEFHETLGSNFVFAADELYLKADQTVPPADYYEDFSQLENGIGLVRLFLDDLDSLLEEIPTGAVPKGKYLIITGISAAPVLEEAVSRLEKVLKGIHVEVLGVENRFFGPMVTVTGLLTGRDISHTLAEYASEMGAEDIKPILSSVTLKAGEDIFLDGYSIEDVEKMTGIKLTVVENSAKGLFQGILGLEV